jgi:hypothetical protein
MIPARAINFFSCPSLIAVALCFCVVMQVLGTPTSLWTMEFETDMVSASLLEGFSLPTDLVISAPTPLSSRRVESSGSLWSVLLEHTLFRPPDTQR